MRPTSQRLWSAEQTPCACVKRSLAISGENSALLTEVPVNQPIAHAQLIAAFKRAQADAAHKSGLIQVVAKKGPKAIQTATETAAKAEKRRDSFAKKLAALGVELTD
jgi:hypothetical protein